VDRNAGAFVPLAHPDRLVMVAHLRTPASGSVPASLHAGSVHDNPWGLQGRFLPDDLEMGGCADWTWDDRVRLSLEAGHQWLLVCQTPTGWTACAEAAGRLPASLCAKALESTRSMRRHLPPAPPFDPQVWKNWLTRLQCAAKET
jgi:beta-N-acetylhexosaminidase